MIYLDEADLIARLFIQEIKINTSFRFPSIKLEFNRIDTLRKHWESRGKNRKYCLEWEKEGSALHLRKQRRKMADAISREISDKAVSYTRRASEKPSARHRLPRALCSFLLFQAPRRRTSCRVMLSLYLRKGG